jgi:hypothetical protein
MLFIYWLVLVVLFSVHIKNVYSDWSSDCTPGGVHTVERSSRITPPACSKLSQSATTPCRLQLWAALQSSVVTSVDHYVTDKLRMIGELQIFRKSKLKACNKLQRMVYVRKVLKILSDFDDKEPWIGAV